MKAVAVTPLGPTDWWHYINCCCRFPYHLDLTVERTEVLAGRNLPKVTEELVG